MEHELIGKITVLAQQKDPHAAASYKAGLRDAEQFWHLWHLMSDDIPQKSELKNQYLKIMNLPDDLK
jgi:hypothetical protein